MMKFFKKNKKGFSLVELIVVIAILGVLAAIVVPRVSGNLETARVNADNSNLRLVRSAVAMFHAQHGRFPGRSAADTHYVATYDTESSLANFNRLATVILVDGGVTHNLRAFLDLDPTNPTMPVARSGWQFRYDPTTGSVTLFAVTP